MSVLVLKQFGAQTINIYSIDPLDPQLCGAKAVLPEVNLTDLEGGMLITIHPITLIHSCAERKQFCQLSSTNRTQQFAAMC